MNEHAFLKSQEIQLRELLDAAIDDPILKPQLEARLRKTEQRLAELAHVDGELFPPIQRTLPRTAIFLSGECVEGTFGITPTLAGNTLIQYEKMFIEQAIHDEREATKLSGTGVRRPKGTPKPSLLFTGTPRGSFGLEFVPQTDKDASFLEVHTKSLRHIAKALGEVVDATSSEKSLDQPLSSIPPKVLGPMKQFLTLLAKHGAELRLAFPDQPSVNLSGEQVKNAADRLGKDVEEEEVEIHGTFRGVTYETGNFDFLSDDGNVITGKVSDEFSEEDIDIVESLTKKAGIARLLTTTVSRVGTSPQITYTLLEARQE